MVLLVLITGAQLTAVDGAWSKRFANETFFKGLFNPCKGSRTRNPVELVKTHVFPTKIFSELGIESIVRFAMKYRVPQNFLYKMGDTGCLFALIWYTAPAGGGNMILPSNVKATHVIAFVKRLTVASRIGLPEIVFHQRGRT